MGYADGMSSITSSSSGNLCSSSLENTRRPSTKTSKAPRAPGTRVTGTPRARSIAAARLAARGL
jgi:hypothetical protein